MTQHTKADDEQDTPGRPKSESSRQQTQPNQGAQTGNPDLDSKAAPRPRKEDHVSHKK